MITYFSGTGLIIREITRVNEVIPVFAAEQGFKMAGEMGNCK
ncbi:MAG: hypothetical protein RR131_08950 [Anaerovorax sp.]